jgi:hypothetical protein
MFHACVHRAPLHGLSAGRPHPLFALFLPRNWPALNSSDLPARRPIAHGLDSILLLRIGGLGVPPLASIFWALPALKCTTMGRPATSRSLFSARTIPGRGSRPLPKPYSWLCAHSLGVLRTCRAHRRLCSVSWVRRLLVRTQASAAAPYHLSNLASWMQYVQPLHAATRACMPASRWALALSKPPVLFSNLFKNAKHVRGRWCPSSAVCGGCGRRRRRIGTGVWGASAAHHSNASLPGQAARLRFCNARGCFFPSAACSVFWPLQWRGAQRLGGGV